MLRISVFLVSLFLAGAAHAQTVPSWMAGDWLSCTGGEDVAETWTSGGDTLLVGAGVTRAKGRVQFEQMRIGKGTNGGLSFFASPNGVAPTEFPLKSQDANRVVFENPAHDFPQRVIYALDGKHMTARIEGRIRERDEGQDWRSAPADLNARCKP